MEILGVVAAVLMSAGLIGFFVATPVGVVKLFLGSEDAMHWVGAGFVAILAAFVAAILGLATSTFGGAA